ncbi:hypothetical protein [Streptacidiphilus neutrinimicus]|uniref:hypothetical protein n=1 Tax=Streptacidiphilus neutrinimicus TaxID=105420 RepID=UPI00126A1D89|nr:hypothetical protein [Streptacidiphilus neutrinimicus]
MSPLAQAMIINGAVLLAVLEADLGPHRKIGAFRILRPLLTAGVLVPLFIKDLTTRGTGLALEIALTAVGLLCGAAAASLTRVYRSPRTGRPVSRAGFGYAALWTVVTGARALFSYGSAHWFGPQLAAWMTTHQVTSDALTDALLLMALSMMLTRTLSLAARAHTAHEQVPAA